MRTLIPPLRPTAALRRLGVQLAFIALLAAALMPTLSRLMQPAGLADQAAFCQVGSSTASPGTPHDDSHEHGDACAFCSLVHATPALGGAALPAVAVLAYAPPVPPTLAPVFSSAPQARSPGARAPPLLA